MSENNAQNNIYLNISYTWEDCIEKFERDKSMAILSLSLCQRDSERFRSVQNSVHRFQGQLDLIVALQGEQDFDNLSRLVSHDILRLGIKDRGWPLWVGCLGPDHYLIRFHDVDMDANQKQAKNLMKIYVKQLQSE